MHIAALQQQQKTRSDPNIYYQQNGTVVQLYNGTPQRNKKQKTTFISKTQMSLTNTNLRERRETQKNMFYMIPFKEKPKTQQ